MVVLSIALITELPHAYTVSGMSLFMKLNSTAKIYADYTFRVLNNDTWTRYPHITTSMTNSSTPEGVTVIATPNSFVGDKHDVYVTYTITAQGHAKGVYVLSLYSCGLTPLVIGLNESEINPTAFTDIVGATSCAVPPQNSPDMNIIGYSEIVSKNIQVNANNTLVVTSVNKLQIPKSPLQQFKSGISANDVKCKDGLQFIMKKENGQFACVKMETANELFNRGWGIYPVSIPYP